MCTNGEAFKKSRRICNWAYMHTNTHILPVYIMSSPRWMYCVNLCNRSGNASVNKLLTHIPGASMFTSVFQADFVIQLLFLLSLTLHVSCEKSQYHNWRVTSLWEYFRMDGFGWYLSHWGHSLSSRADVIPRYQSTRERREADPASSCLCEHKRQGRGLPPQRKNGFLNPTSCGTVQHIHRGAEAPQARQPLAWPELAVSQRKQTS